MPNEGDTTIGTYGQYVWRSGKWVPLASAASRPPAPASRPPAPAYPYPPVSGPAPEQDRPGGPSAPPPPLAPRMEAARLINAAFSAPTPPLPIDEFAQLPSFLAQQTAPLPPRRPVSDAERPLSAGPAFDAPIGGRGSRAGRAPFLASRADDREGYGFLSALSAPLAKFGPGIENFVVDAASALAAAGFAIPVSLATDLSLQEAYGASADYLQATAQTPSARAGIDPNDEQGIRDFYSSIVDPERTIDLEAPASEQPWWHNMPGGIGMFAGMEEYIRDGNLLQNVTPQIQTALGLTDQEMLAAGYVFDEATNRWVVLDSEDLGDAQAGLGGGGYYYGGGGGGYGFNFTYPSASRTAQGLGLVNWRI